MSPLIAVAEHIAQARQMDDGSPMLPWSSFADFFKSRVYDRRLVNRPFLTYYDDDRQLHCTYSYAEFGAVVERTAAVLHDRMGLTLGDRIATVLFNHDLAVILYFAAWTRGIAVVPINAEEPAEKKRYILERSEASSVFCWHDYLNEIMSLQSALPALYHIVSVGDDGLCEGEWSEARDRRHRAPTASRFGPRTSSLDDEALIVYTSGTTGPSKAASSPRTTS